MMKAIIRAGLGLALAVLLFACTKIDENADTRAGDTNIQAASVVISTVQAAADSTAGTFQDLSGRPLEISDFAGRKLLINYWATWCAPCIKEIPSLSSAAQQLGSEDYVVVLASDESLETISTFIAENEFSGNFIKLNTFFASHGIQAVPSTVLYDEFGQELNSWLGAYEWDSEAVLAELRSYE